ncbi:MULTISPECIES: YcbK family protein [unclassified Coleofasciculus]|uniref:YcbK family protein n=1 Tax=unclassified Coleofasciculus TaxID=2692782 RepID=UPI00188301B7|nr:MULTISPECIES: D-Ala-D-Ala carboxypeptidase family metallohydrolase [unclassified Coleofasciculus]MBE9127503.1 DUF882 domain-containing protein [Coleofasciculus sp. LEGE 07081]MBE9150835.1 DUF882 domain-containing protein [Coleofasciculus sp. LEGE 07092]
MVQQILRVTQDTVFKLHPVQSTQLTEEERHPVSEGTTFEIASYAYSDASGDFDGHIKFALKNDVINGLNTWFVYSLHIQVELDGEVVYPKEDQEAAPILRVTKNTLFKRLPVQSEMLPAEELYNVAAGKSYTLHGYAYADSRGDFSSHIKFSIRYPQDYIRNLNTWFVYDKHAYVEFDGTIVYPPQDPNTPILRITENTLFKRRPLQSSELSDQEVYSISEGSTWKLHSFAYATPQGDFNDHIKFALKYEKDYIWNLSTWYVYEGHAQVERNGEVLYPLPQPPSPQPQPFLGRSFKLPGNVSTFYTDQPIIPGGNFTWGEATKNATRIPENETIVNNIIALARQLQRARNQIDRPFQVNSWYRPPAINRAVGGARYSQHLYGKAVDIQVSGYSGRRLSNAVMSWWPGGVGIYSNLPKVVHLDIGSRRIWGF